MKNLIFLLYLVSYTTGIGYKIHPNYPIAFSPVIYFCIDILTSFFLFRYYLNSNQTGKECSSPNPEKGNPLLSQEEILRYHNITGRELQILRLILDGYNNREIGKKLFISSNTVRNHIYNIYKKLGTKSRCELIKFFH